MKFTERIKKIFSMADRKRREYVVEAQNYAETHKNTLLIQADPATDIIVIAYKDLIVPVHFHKEGKRLNVIENALNYRKMNNSVDTFLLAIDGALSSIATTLYNRKHGTNHKMVAEQIFQEPASDQKPETLSTGE